MTEDEAHAIMEMELTGEPQPKKRRRTKGPASIAPAYAFLYPILCEAAIANGYALALHGSMKRDLDVIAVPWTDDAVSREELVEAVKRACDGWIIHAADSPNPSPDASPAIRAHGRMAWSIYITDGVYVDLSVMPRIPTYEKGD
jgi:hypothetical protein